MTENQHSQNQSDPESSSLRWFFLAYFIIFLSVAVSLYLTYAQIGAGYGTSSSILFFLFVDAWITTSPLLLWGGRWRWTVFLPLLGVALLSIGLVWYYRQFGTALPLQSLFLTGNYSIALPSVPELMEPMDIVILIPLGCTCVTWALCRKIGQIPGRIRAKFAVVLLILLSVFPLQYLLRGKCENLTAFNCKFGIPDRQHVLPVSNAVLLNKTGLFRWFTLEIWNWISPPEISKSAIQQVDRFFEEQASSRAAAFTNAGSTTEHDVQADASHANVSSISEFSTTETPSARPRNLILIIVESFASRALKHQLDGVEITPCLNRCLDEPTTLYLPYILPQTRDGNTSDAQLILNTGLLPISSGPSIYYYGNQYYSLAKYLAPKGYSIKHFTCDYKCFWNQTLTLPAFGYTSLQDRRDLQMGDENLDEQMFRHVLPILSRTPQPFLAQMVTLSMHSPWTKELIAVNFPRSACETPEEYYYFNAVAYTDHCLGDFLDSLRTAGLYENTTIVITGDHQPPALQLYEADRPVPLDECYLPLIILNCPLPIDTAAAERVYGQIDIFPTLLRLMDTQNVPFTGLGQSIFENRDDCAAYKTGEIVGKNHDPVMIQKKQSLWEISNTIIRSDYFRDHPLPPPHHPDGLQP
ncbi:MAG: sulfatase-like hydrolase/transferase [Thermoguttaceae bacterium]|nr:sulfatase-like hydrolase/transferase [Thermoguttaceae bacterium]